MAFLEQQAVSHSYLFTSVAGAPLHEPKVTEAFRLVCDHAKVPECHPPYRKPLAGIWQGKGGGFRAGAAGHRTPSAEGQLFARFIDTMVRRIEALSVPAG